MGIAISSCEARRRRRRNANEEEEEKINNNDISSSSEVNTHILNDDLVVSESLVLKFKSLRGLLFFNYRLFPDYKKYPRIIIHHILNESLVFLWKFKSLRGLLFNYRLFPAANNTNPPLIPEDIIRLEILPRLPVKSLMRFQCVCKSWQLLISYDSVFKESHLARTSIDPNNDCLIVRCISKLPPTSRSRPNKSDHPLLSSDMHLAGSVNGLVCLYRYDWGSKSIPCIGIWNPATHHYKYVPPPSTASVEVTDFSFAFGFDPVKNDYKVIYITINKARLLVADVYSCNAGSWGNINVSSSFILKDGSKLSDGGFNINESFYWSYGRGSYVISFDIGHEVFRLFPGLNYLPNKHMAMVNLRNSLAYIAHDRADSTFVDVYVLNEKTMSCDGGTWSKMYTVGPITLTWHMRILRCFKNGDMLFKDDKQLKLVCIDPETHAMLGSSIHPIDTSRFDLSYAFGLGYTETLISVVGMKHISTNECDLILFIE